MFNFRDGEVAMERLLETQILRISPTVYGVDCTRACTSSELKAYELPWSAEIQSGPLPNRSAYLSIFRLMVIAFLFSNELIVFMPLFLPSTSAQSS